MFIVDNRRDGDILFGKERRHSESESVECSDFQLDYTCEIPSFFEAEKRFQTGEFQTGPPFLYPEGAKIPLPQNGFLTSRDVVLYGHLIGKQNINIPKLEDLQFEVSAFSQSEEMYP